MQTNVDITVCIFGTIILYVFNYFARSLLPFLYTLLFITALLQVRPNLCKLERIVKQNNAIIIIIIIQLNLMFIGPSIIAIVDE